jgi:hypothetical protein
VKGIGVAVCSGCMVVEYYAATIFPEDTPFTKMFSCIEGGNRKLREEPTDGIRTWSNRMEFCSEFLACSAVLSFQYLLNDAFVRVSFCDRSSNCFVHIPPNIPLMNSIIQVADVWVCCGHERALRTGKAWCRSNGCRTQLCFEEKVVAQALNDL